MKVVVKISGHLISNKDNPVNVDYLKRLANVITEAASKHRFGLVVGGGYLSRIYISACRSLGFSNSIIDLVGIYSTRINATILQHVLGDSAIKVVPQSIDEAIRFFELGKILVMGGLQPGQSTTAVAALLAEGIGADILIITTDVDGVYTSDPKTDPKARKLNEVSINWIYNKFIREEGLPGTYKLLDHLTLMILRRSKIPTYIINGQPPINILKVIEGEHIGTKVIYD
ncbi:MAG: UMP kinase [Thermoprotei archaeon]|nr:MAG: UMP kinase [Thermoprotei archaeon]